MKIEIIDRAGYTFMKKVKLPIIVEGRPLCQGFMITTRELRNAGVPVESCFSDDYEWCFSGLRACKAEEEARKASLFARFNNWLRKL
ncbi:hypothetical protein Makalu003_073 [Escherichia phage Ec_Makalu_003]|uniref:Uncharacterized protein n=1 Tax=Escherichia phage Ec_Makalu_003 TaxID=2704944 RepID=A0A6B9SQJ2_9CAUD|nr:hypothetical protein Makalu003_073 [Escherichia phage Ec_Makalu_003]